MNRALSFTLRNLLMSWVLGISMGATLLMTTANAADSPPGDYTRGATSWSQNCMRCHEMRDPTEFRDDLWRPIMTHMRIRAGLTGQQQRDILKFLQSSNNP